jgi:hypothetical protein
VAQLDLLALVFVRETQVDTGAQPDNTARRMSCKAKFDHHGFFPEQKASGRSISHLA